MLSSALGGFGAVHPVLGLAGIGMGGYFGDEDDEIDQGSWDDYDSDWDDEDADWRPWPPGDD